MPVGRDNVISTEMVLIQNGFLAVLEVRAHRMTSDRPSNISVTSEQ